MPAVAARKAWWTPRFFEDWADKHEFQGRFLTEDGDDPDAIYFIFLINTATDPCTLRCLPHLLSFFLTTSLVHRDAKSSSLCRIQHPLLPSTNKTIVPQPCLACTSDPASRYLPSRISSIL